MSEPKNPVEETEIVPPVDGAETGTGGEVPVDAPVEETPPDDEGGASEPAVEERQATPGAGQDEQGKPKEEKPPTSDDVAESPGDKERQERGDYIRENEAVLNAVTSLRDGFEELWESAVIEIINDHKRHGSLPENVVQEIVDRAKAAIHRRGPAERVIKASNGKVTIPVDGRWRVEKETKVAFANGCMEVMRAGTVVTVRTHGIEGLQRMDEFHAIDLTKPI